MSTLSNLFEDLLSLIFPNECLGCGKLLTGRVKWICLECHATMPSTYFHLSESNPVADKLRSLCPTVVNATSQFYYINKGHWRNAIHEIKYHGAWRAATQMGYWYGCELIESPLYQDIDIIVPIPIHFSRRLKRRYNQSEKIADGLAKAMGVRVKRRALRRMRNNPSQVTRQKRERWSNVSNIFTVLRPEQLSGKHILLVDDVFTTGATLISCIETILRETENCRISVATLAVSRNEILGRAI